jgi:hypothetical protein
MGKHFKRKQQQWPVPGTRKPLRRPIQPKDIPPVLVSPQQQQQANLTDEEMLEQLIKYRDSLVSGPGAVALPYSIDEEIRVLRERIEVQHRLKPKRRGRNQKSTERPKRR